MINTFSDNCLILLADSNFNIFAENQIDSKLKSELLQKGIPKGSMWKKFAGARSIALFPLSTFPDFFGISYSLIMDDIDRPIISFVMVVDRTEMTQVIRRQLNGIQSIFLRHLNRFASLNSKYSESLRRSLVFHLETGEEKYASPKTITEKGKTLFISKYQHPSQWMLIEKLVVENSIHNQKEAKSFRTLALQLEQEYRVLGIAQDSGESFEKNNHNVKIIALTIILLLLLLLLLITVAVLYYYYQTKSANGI